MVGATDVEDDVEDTAGIEDVVTVAAPPDDAPQDVVTHTTANAHRATGRIRTTPPLP